MAATWSVSSCHYLNEFEGHEQVVDEVYYVVTAANAPPQPSVVGRHAASVSLRPLSLDSFIDWDNLTPADVLGWVQVTLGPERVTAIEAQVEQSVAEDANPTQGEGLPW
jgi:hypothetical protein